MKKKTLIITLGDPLGIGPEITLKALKNFPQNKADFIIIGDRDSLKNFENLPNIKTCEVKSDFKKTAQHKATKWAQIFPLKHF